MVLLFLKPAKWNKKRERGESLSMTKYNHYIQDSDSLSSFSSELMCQALWWTLGYRETSLGDPHAH
jgi:hypothetical protein